MGYMKDSVNTEADDQYGADQACDDESAAVPDKRGMEYVFQYQTAKINDSDYQQNIDKRKVQKFFKTIYYAIQKKNRNR